MARKVPPEAVPPDIRLLMPESQKKLVVVGADTYEMLPLTEAMVEKVTEEMTRIAAAFITEGKRQETGGQAKSLVDILISDGCLKNIVAKVLDLPPGIVQEITFPQIAHIASVLYQQNFDLKSLLSEHSHENFTQVLELLGLKKTVTAADKVLQKIEDEFTAALENHPEGLSRQQILDCLTGQYRLSKSSPMSPKSTDGPSTISGESGKNSVPSPETAATSGDGKTVTTVNGGLKKTALSPEALRMLRAVHSTPPTATPAGVSEST